jgi:hypothetical protein
VLLLVQPADLAQGLAPGLPEGAGDGQLLQGGDEFLLRLLDHDLWDPGEPPLSYTLCAEIGKVKNPFMLPVLMEIITLRHPGDATISVTAAAFTRKEAVLHFVAIKGERNLTAEDRRKIREECDTNARLSSFPAIKALRKSL